MGCVCGGGACPFLYQGSQHRKTETHRDIKAPGSPTKESSPFPRALSDSWDSPTHSHKTLNFINYHGIDVGETEACGRDWIVAELALDCQSSCISACLTHTRKG